MSYKNGNIIMLPSKNKSSIILVGEWGKLYKGNSVIVNCDLDKDESYQNLLLISDEPIVDGEIVVVIESHKDLLKNDIFVYRSHIHSIDTSKCRKVLASTDKNKIWNYGLPPHSVTKRIPQIKFEFVDTYIKYWSDSPDGNIIDVIQYECEDEPTTDGNSEKYSKIKINEDGTVNIKLAGHTYTREEVIEKIKHYRDATIRLNDMNNATDYFILDVDLFASANI